ncbi:PREDICTED: uncharacterized protein LOC104611686 [Nelumbo nucifera]|uniref:Uncharacterized protein LOC104611686 n=2 Tax=Nelumbo nucifera TaxID=4432 RepID=A0A1U8B7X9_NELNU|nr:PREDICTED: uncharacterized protein LOC104611686 [Nelumbo nucifera]DAD21400.1 TPA_asm: hypothetical protein HUJ06_022863 [Nelumbo nucifera]
MGGQWVVKKPSRSDEVSDADEQLRIAEEIRAHFDSITPKRPKKPNRSETDITTITTTESDQISTFEGDNIPELHKFLYLQSQSLPISVKEGDSIVQEEFVETQYYKEFNSIDKQHHTIGSGFIKMMGEGGDGYGLGIQRSHDGGTRKPMTRFRSNPATNDWVPSFEEEHQREVTFISSKPSRSESLVDG